jgi:hypothetical protein
MASQTKSCGLGQTVDRGEDDWLSPTNIYASDDARAYVGLQLDELTDYLWATTFGFTIYRWSKSLYREEEQQSNRYKR